MRVFLDANILFSASQAGSPMCQFTDWLTAAGHVLVTSDYAGTEAERNVTAKRPEWSAGLGRLRRIVELAAADTTDCGDVTLNAADRPILGAALATRCDRLLTGDLRHFGALMGRTIGGVRIVNARGLAEELAASG